MAALLAFCKTLFCVPRCRSRKSAPPDAQPPPAFITNHSTIAPSKYEGDKPNPYEEGYAALHSPPPSSSSSFHEQARRIAQVPVAGIRRTAGPSNMGFVTTFETARGPLTAPRATGPGASADDRTLRSDDGSTSATLVGDGGWGAGVARKEGSWTQAGYPDKKSAWHGKPNGTVYDRREELSEEDEDMWARLAM